MVRGMHEYCALDSAKQASDNETLPFFSYTAERRSLSACQFHCVGASGEQASRDSHTLARPFICSFKARLAPVHPPGPALILSFSFLISLSLSLSLLSFSLPLAPLSPADSDCPSLFPFQTQSAIPCPVTTSYDQFPHRLYLYQQLRLASTSAQLTRIHKSGHAPFHHHNRHNRHNHRAGTSGVQPGIHNDR